MHVAAAAGDVADRGDDVGVDGLLEDVAGGAGVERLADVARVVLHREDQHLRLGRVVQHVRDRLDARLPGHDDVHQDHVGLRRARLEDGVPRVAGLADDLDVRPRPRAPCAGRCGRRRGRRRSGRGSARSSQRTIAGAPRRRSSCRRPGWTRSSACRPAARAARPSRAGRDPRAPASGAKPRPSSSITAVIARGAAREDDADRARLRVLDDVRQRLLHDPVERCLDVARQPVADAAPRARRACPVCSANVSRRRSSAGDEAEVVERLRPQLDRQPAHVVQRLDDLLAHGGERLGRAPRPSSPPRRAFSPSSTEVSSCPVWSCSSRASRRRSSSCASTTRRSASPATRAERSTATAARGAKVSASRRSSSVKRGSLAFLVVGDDHADRPPAAERAARRARCVRRGAGPTPGRPRDRRASESTRSARRRSSTRPLFEPARSSCMPTISAAPLAVGGLDPERPVAGRQRDRDEPRADQPRSRRAISSSRRGSSISLASAVPTSFSASSCRDQRVAASYRRAFSIATAAWLASVSTSSWSSAVNEPSLLLGQVEVPEGTTAQQDRHAEEAAHRRMVRREADRARIVGDRLEPQRPGVA